MDQWYSFFFKIGPVEWARVSGNCSMSEQSPINIVTRNRIFDKQLLPFELTGSQNVFNGSLENNGHTGTSFMDRKWLFIDGFIWIYLEISLFCALVQLNLPDNITLKGGNLPTTYKALQLHLHWGKDGGPGSEHTIDGERFPMEVCNTWERVMNNSMSFTLV